MTYARVGEILKGAALDAKQKKQHDAVLAALKMLGRARFKQAEAQAVKFDPSSWSRYLLSADRKPLDSILRALPEALARESMTRQDVVKMADAATTDARREALLVAALVWGKGPRNNRMFPSFVRLLSDPRLATALTTSANHAREGRPADAYRAWRKSGVRGLGEAFFTKWLWAASHIGGNEFTVDRPRCLVLDIRVWNSLGHKDHAWSSVIAAETKRRAERYEAYTRACALWAEELRVTAEQVEWALFTANGSIRAMSTQKT